MINRDDPQVTSKPETLLTTRLIDHVNPNALEEAFMEEENPDEMGIDNPKVGTAKVKYVKKP